MGDTISKKTVPIICLSCTIAPSFYTTKFRYEKSRELYYTFLQISFFVQKLNCEPWAKWLNSFLNFQITVIGTASLCTHYDD